MSNAPEIQMKLREELLSVDTETPSMDELMALPYLDAVVRETLRVYPPVPNSMRIAMKDDVLSVEKPYTDKNGVVHESIRYTSVSPVANPMYILSLSCSISKGDLIFIPIMAINRSQELWGPDAHEFKCVSFLLVAYFLPHVPPPTIGLNGGKTFRRPSRRFQACGVT
jgi:cytochrome P450